MKGAERGGGNPERENHGSDRSTPQMKGGEGRHPRKVQQIFSKGGAAEIQSDGHGGSGSDLPPRGRFEYNGEDGEQQKKRAKIAVCLEKSMEDTRDIPLRSDYFPQKIIQRYLSLKAPMIHDAVNLNVDLLETGMFDADAIAQERTARKAFGRNITTKAKELEIVERHTVDDIKQIVVPDEVPWLDSVASWQEWEEGNGWTVFSLKDDDQLLLVMPQKQEDGSFILETSNLDLLSERDPDFLSTEVEDVAKKIHYSSAVNSAMREAKLHFTPEQEILPDLLQQLAAIATPEDREKEIDAMQTYTEYAGIAMQTNTRLTLSSALVGRYLRHKSQCGAESEADQQKHNDLLRVNESFHSAPSRESLSDEASQREDPYAEFYEPKKHHAEVFREKAILAAMSTIVSERAVLEGSTLHHLLQEQFPDAYQSIQYLQEQPGRYGAANALDSIVSDLAFTARLIDHPDSGLPLETAIDKQLSDSLSWKEEKAGKFSRKDLKLLLPPLVLGAAYERVKDEKLAYEGNVEQMREKLLEHYTHAIGEIDTIWIGLSKKRASIARFQKEHDLSDEEIEMVANAAQKTDNPLKDNADREAFRGIFEALLLSKEGKVDLHSPVFKSFLKTLYPEKAESIEDAL